MIPNSRMRLPLKFFLAGIPIFLFGFLAHGQDTLMREPLPGGVNSGVEEEYPFLSADGSALWFSRKNSRRNFGSEAQSDIWISYRESGNTWSRPVNVGAPLNSSFHDRVLAVNAAGARVYLLRWPGPDAAGADPEFLISLRQGRRWSDPVPLPIEDTLTLGPHSSLSIGPDEKIMVFSQRSEDDAGGYDLYVSFRDYYGVWTSPTSLGPQVNTPGEERKVHLAADGRTLYFSSDGQGKGNGTDIFRTVRQDETWTNWSPPERIGPPFSTTADDDGFSLPASGSYMILHGQDENGSSGLYALPMPDSLAPFGVCLVRASILDDSLSHFDEVEAVFFPAGSGMDESKSIEVQPDGSFTTILPYEAGRGQLLVAIPGRFPGAYPLPDTTWAPTMLDREMGEFIEMLKENRSYANREEEIIGLYGRIAEVESEITDIDRNMVELNNPRQHELPTLDSNTLHGPALQAIRDRYEPDFEARNRRRMPYDSLLTSREGEPEISRRLRRIRSRFMENFRQRDNTEPSPAESETDARETPIFSFDRYVGRYWSRRLGQEGTLLRYRMEEARIDEMLEEERGKGRSDVTRIQALEARLATVRESMEDLQGRPQPSRRREGTWLDSLNQDLDQALEEAFRDSVTALWEPRLDEFIEISRRKFNLNRQKQSLQSSLEQLIAQQINMEQDMMQKVSLDPDRIRSTDPIPDRSYREEILVIEPIPFELGRNFRLDGVRFLANAPTLTPGSHRQLDLLIDLLEQHPQMGLSISCHTHGQLTHINAQSLTNARAKTISNYLQEKGIPAYRIRSRGLGKLQPVTTDNSPAGRRANQRAEVSLFLAAG